MTFSFDDLPLPNPSLTLSMSFTIKQGIEKYTNIHASFSHPLDELPPD